MESSRKNKLIKTFLKIIVSICGISFIFYKIPLDKIASNWTESTLPWLIFMLVITFLGMVIQANRWKGLSLEAGKKIPFRIYYAYIAIGYFFTAFLPGGFGGDIVKTLAFGKRFNQTSQSVAAILISRVQGLLVLFALFFVSLPWVLIHYSVPLPYTFGMLAALVISLLAILFCLFSDKLMIPEKVTKKIKFIPKLQAALALYRGNKKQFFLSFIDSFWLQLIVFLTSYAYFRSVGIELDLRIVIVFSGIIIIITMLPISFNGIGVREWVTLSLYTGILGLPADKVLAGNLLGYILILFQALQGGIAFALQKKIV
ncbi:MAG: lysylphosphatidylglycerol synthase transmembrane domain-containing protein [Fibrobacteraceae bacterium]